MFLYLDHTENENGGFYTYETSKIEMMVSTHTNAQNENAGLYMFKYSNQKWRLLYEENTKNQKNGENRFRTSVREFVSFVHIQVSARRTPKNEYSSFYMYRTNS